MKKQIGFYDLGHHSPSITTYWNELLSETGKFDIIKAGCPCIEHEFVDGQKDVFPSITILHPSYMNKECPEKLGKILEKYNNTEFLVTLFMGNSERDRILSISEQIGFASNIKYLLDKDVYIGAFANNTNFVDGMAYIRENLMKL